MLALEVVAGPGARVLPLAAGLPDDLFEHDGQITKREIRAVTLSALAPRRGEMLWDIGAGVRLGRDRVDAAPTRRTAPSPSRRAPERAARIAPQRRWRSACPALAVVEGTAPDALAGLPRAGRGVHRRRRERPGVLEAAWAALRPGGRLVANAVTLETEALLLGAPGRARRRADPHRGRAAGPRSAACTASGPAMPVTQWAAVKP